MIRPQESDFGLAVTLSLAGFDKIRFEDHMASPGEALARVQLEAKPSSVISFHPPERSPSPHTAVLVTPEAGPTLTKPQRRPLWERLSTNFRLRTFSQIFDYSHEQGPH